MKGTNADKKGMFKKVAMANLATVLVAAILITTLVTGAPDRTLLVARAETTGTISSANGKNEIPDTYRPVNVRNVMLVDKDGREYSDDVAAFDFHIFAENFSSNIHTCGNIAVKNLGVTVNGTTSAPEFGSRANHETSGAKLSYIENAYDWCTAADADYFVFGPNNNVSGKGQIFLTCANGKKIMMGNGDALLGKSYLDDSTPYIDVTAELEKAEDYQRALVKLMDDGNNANVKVIDGSKISSGFFGTTIDLSSYPEDTIIIDFDEATYYDFWSGKYLTTSEAITKIAGMVNIKGTKGKRVIFNVDTKGIDNFKFNDTNMTADNLKNSEDTANMDNNILWNFYERDGSKITSSNSKITLGGTWIGTILAPDAQVVCKAGLNGSIIANSVATYCETHKSDYTGEKSIGGNITITANKIWDDNPDTRPKTLTVKLLRNGEIFKTVQLSENSDPENDTFHWEYDFTDLPMHDPMGNAYKYTIEEVVPAGYKGKTVNYDMVNTSPGGPGPAPEVEDAKLTVNKTDGSTFLAGASLKLTINNKKSLAGATAKNKESTCPDFRATETEITWTSTGAAVEIEHLPYGEYTLTEVSAPAGYTRAQEMRLVVDKNNKAAKFDMVDNAISTKIKKIDENGAMLSGATLVLTSNNGVDLSGVYAPGAAVTSSSITWTSTLTEQTLSKIPAGSYLLTETEAPDGYDIAAPIVFTITEDGKTIIDGAQKSSVAMTDKLKPKEPSYYGFYARKLDDKGNGLVGAKFRLRSLSYPDTKLEPTFGFGTDGGYDNSVPGQIEFTNGEDNKRPYGAFGFTNLIEGSYILEEIEAPDGYKLADPITFTLDDSGINYMDMDNILLTMVDEANEITVSKKDTTTGKMLPGAAMILGCPTGVDTHVIKDNIVGAKPGSVEIPGEAGGVVKNIQWVTDETEVIIRNMPAGDYILWETLAPAGYSQLPCVIHFSVDQNGNVVDIDYTDAVGTSVEKPDGVSVDGNNFVIYDDTNTIKIEKVVPVDSKIYPLAGATFKLTPLAGQDLSGINGSEEVTYDADTNTATWESSATPNILHGIPDGKYKLSEIVTPDGFETAADVEITVNGSTVTVTGGGTIDGTTDGKLNAQVDADGNVEVYDYKKPYYSLNLSKLDEAGNIKPGAKLAIFNEDARCFEENEALLVFTSKSTPEQIDIPDGKYVLVELEAPEGYDKTDQKVCFEVSSTGIKLSLDESERARASYGKPSDNEGVHYDQECYYSLETTKIFEQFGEYPEIVYFDLPVQYKCTNLKLVKDEYLPVDFLYDGTPTVDSTASTAENNRYVATWNVDGEYDANSMYYAVMTIVNADGTPADPNEVGNIDLHFVYDPASLGGNSQPVIDSTASSVQFQNSALRYTSEYMKLDKLPEKIIFEVLPAEGKRLEEVRMTSIGLFVRKVGEESSYLQKWTEAGNTFGVEDPNTHNYIIELGTASVSGQYNYDGPTDLNLSGNDSYFIEIQYGNVMNEQGFSSNNQPAGIKLYIDSMGGGGNISGNMTPNEATARTKLDVDEISFTDVTELRDGDTIFIKLPNEKSAPSAHHLCAVELTKVDADDADTKLSGAQFILINDKDELVGNITGSNGVYKYEETPSGAVVNSKAFPLVTDSNGKLVVSKLDEGTYRFVEIMAPDGYNIDQEETRFILNLGHLDDSPKTLTVTNTKKGTKNGELTLIKTDDAGTTKEGAQFELYRIKLDSSFATNSPEKVKNAVTNDYTFTTDSTGRFNVSGLDENYLYYAVEKTAPLGTSNSNGSEKLPKLDVSTNTQPEQTSRYYKINGAEVNYGVVICNEDCTATATVEEYGTELKEVDGKNVWVWNSTGTSVTEALAANIPAVDTAFKTTIQKTDGTALLPGATLRLAPVVAADYYGRSILNEVTVDGAASTEKNITRPHFGSDDAADYYPDASGNKIYKVSEEYIDFVTSGSDIVISGLPAGDYTLSEISVPYGYEKAEPVTFTVDTNGKTLINSHEVSAVTMVDTKLSGVLKLVKQDDVSGKLVSGAGFTLQKGTYNEESGEWSWADVPGKTGTTDSKGVLSFTDLEVGGTYRLHETAFPTGYDDSEEVYTDPVTIDPNGDVTKDGTVLYANANALNTPYGTASYQAVITKSLTGRDIIDGEFEFSLVEVTDANGNTAVEGGVSLTVSNTDSSAVFEEISYTAPGTHYYKISEVYTGKPGVAYDTDTSYVVKVEVKSGTNHSLTVTADKDEDDLVFENVYTPDSVEAVIKAYKKLSGRDMAADEFSFNLKGNGVDETKNNTASADGAENEIVFSKLTYTKAGTYTYTLTEVDGDKAKVDYDDTVYTVTVTVTDDPATGKLSAAVTYNNGTKDCDKALFINEYDADDTSATIKASKILNGRDMNKDEFEFVLTDVTDPAKPKTIESKKNGAAADGAANIISFTDISYNESGTYTYTITETKDSAGGITYDDTVYTVTVVVSDDPATGKLSTEVTYNNGTKNCDKALFTNEYAIKSATDIVLVANKTLANRALTAGEFLFDLVEVDVDGNVIPGGVKQENVTNDKDGNITFAKITYTEPGTKTHYYLITEVRPDDATAANNYTVNGITYAHEPQKVTVTVTDNGEGKLIATAAYPTGGATFANVFTPSGVSLTLKGEKVLEGREFLDNEKVTFTICEGKETVTTGAATEECVFSFAPINYTLEDVGTHTYTVKETDSGLGGVEYDTTERTIKVKVENNNGILVATAYESDGTTPLTDNKVDTFTNKYTVQSVTASVSGVKTLKDAKTETERDIEAKDYIFDLKSGSDIIASTDNAADGSFSFNREFKKAKTYTYTISERTGSADGIIYSADVYTWIIVVKDDLNGNLYVESNTIKKGTQTVRTKNSLTVAENLSVSGTDFENIYNAGSVSVPVYIFKALENAANCTTSAFTFRIEEKNASGGYDKIADVNAGVTNKALLKQFSFDTVGEHEYRITEVTPSDAVLTGGKYVKNGVTYDDTVYTLKIKVEDIGGKLEATTTVGTTATTDELVFDFENTYAPSGSASASVSGIKELTGGRKQALQDGEFTFQLLSDTDIIDDVQNDDGGFGFTRNFTAAGTYTYTIKEDRTGTTNGVKDGVTYDDTEYTWTVVVKDNGTGGFAIDSNTITKNSSSVGTVSDDKSVVSGADFENAYAITGSTNATVSGTKTMSGSRSVEDNEFTFKLHRTDANANGEADVTVNNRKDATSGNSIFSFTKSLSAPGTYVYELTEVEPEAAERISGVSYSGEKYIWTVTVDDNSVGGLAVTANKLEKVGENGERTTIQDCTAASVSGAQFTNRYQPTSAKAGIAASKILNGRDMNKDEFEFVLTDVTDPAKPKTIESKKNGAAADGAANIISFTDISYTDAGEYKYTVTEKHDGITPDAGGKYIKNGVIYDTTVQNVTVKVTDVNGVLKTEVSYTNSAPAAEFENNYKASGDINVQVKGIKNLDGKPATTPYGFILVDGADQTAVSSSDTGAFSFSKKLTEKGTYVYTIKEDTAGTDSSKCKDGVIYDTTEYTWTVVVKDNLDGTLSIESNTLKNKSEQTNVASGTQSTIEGANFNNTSKRYAVDFIKKDADSSIVLSGADLMLKPVDEGIDMSKVTIPANAKYDPKTNSVMWTSGKSKTTIGNLERGRYEFSELTAPKGYHKAAPVYVKVDVTGISTASAPDAQKWDKLKDTTVTMLDEPIITHDAVFSKKKAGGGNELPGAILTLTPVDKTISMSDVELPAGKVTRTGNVLKWVSSNEPTEIGKLPCGVYAFTEITAPEGYEKAETIYVKVAQDGIYSMTKADYDAKKSDWGKKVADDTVIMYDQAKESPKEPEPVKADFSFVKYSDIGQTLSGAVFCLKDSTGKCEYKSSGNDGKVTFPDLAVGSYTLTEQTAPADFTKSSAKLTVVVEEDGTLVFKDEQSKELQLPGVESRMVNCIQPVSDKKTVKVNDVIDVYADIVKRLPALTNSKLTFKSDDVSVATVDEYGKVTIKKPGKATITIMDNGVIVGTYVLGANDTNSDNPGNYTPDTGDHDAPVTGDDSDKWNSIAVSVLLISAMAAAAIVTRRRRRKA